MGVQLRPKRDLITIILDPGQREQLKEMSQAEDRSINNWMRRLFHQAWEVFTKRKEG